MNVQLDACYLGVEIREDSLHGVLFLYPSTDHGGRDLPGIPLSLDIIYIRPNDELGGKSPVFPSLLSINIIIRSMKLAIKQFPSLKFLDNHKQQSTAFLFHWPSLRQLWKS